MYLNWCYALPKTFVLVSCLATESYRIFKPYSSSVAGTGQHKSPWPFPVGYIMAATGPEWMFISKAGRRGSCWFIYPFCQESKSFSRSFHHICASILSSQIVCEKQREQVAFAIEVGKGERAGNGWRWADQ